MDFYLLSVIVESAMNDSPFSEDVMRVQALIDERPVDSRRRIAMTAQILRDLMAEDKASGGSGFEIELAFTLVMAELADG